MKALILKALQYAAFATMFGFLGGLANQFVGWQDLQPGDRGTWTGAIGTLLAFGGTIWLARSETRRREQEERNLAIATAAGLSIRVHNLRSALIHVQEYFAVQQQQIHDFSAYRSWADHISLFKTWTAEEIAALLCLPNDTAGKLAMAKELIEHLFDRIQQEQGSSRALSRPVSVGAHEAFIKILNLIVIMLKSPLDECMKIGNPAGLGGITLEQIVPSPTVQ